MELMTDRNCKATLRLVFPRDFGRDGVGVGVGWTGGRDSVLVALVTQVRTTGGGQEVRRRRRGQAGDSGYVFEGRTNNTGFGRITGGLKGSQDDFVIPSNHFPFFFCFGNFLPGLQSTHRLY